MYSITINAKTAQELENLSALLAGHGVNKTPEKTLADFGLQEITDFLAEHHRLHVVEAQPQAAAPKAKKKEKPVEEPSLDPAGLKADAMSMLNGVYAQPEGKKIAMAILKEFSVRNFNSIPDHLGDEFHRRTLEMLDAAGLVGA
jgi:hypothetical protein